MARQADANVTIGADATAFSSTMKEVAKNTDTMANSITARLARVGQAFTGLQAIGGGAVSMAGSFYELGKALLEPAISAEKLQVSLTGVIGSEAGAIEMIEELNKYAAETPFRFDDIASSAELLLAGTDLGAERVLGVVKDLGDVAAMTGKDLGSMAQLYMQAVNTGLDGRVIKSFERAGFAVRGYIADLQGISMDEVQAKAAAGELSIVHLNAALAEVVGPAGKANGATKDLALTFDGLTSTLQDNIQLAVRGFGEGVLPAIKPVLVKIIELVQAAQPEIEILGAMLGEWLGEKVQDGLPALDELMLKIPEIADEIVLMADKVGDLIDVLAFVPGMAGDWFSRFTADGYALGKMMQGFSWDASSDMAAKEFGLGEYSSEELLKKRQEARRKDATDRRAAGEKRAAELKVERKREAETRDAERDAKRAASSEALTAERELSKQAMAEDERKKTALKEQKALLEANTRAAEAYAAARANWEEKRADAALAGLSVGGQRKALTSDARGLGVGGAVSAESIRGRMDALAAAGAGKHAGEIAQLDKLLQRWEALTERAKNYKAATRVDGVELRAQYMELTGREALAAKLREEEKTRQRIIELTEQGMAADKARGLAAVESKMRQVQALNAGQGGKSREFIQTSLASQGGGGVSLRLSNQVTESKKQSKLLSDIYRYMQNNVKISKTGAILA